MKLNCFFICFVLVIILSPLNVSGQSNTEFIGKPVKFLLIHQASREIINNSVLSPQSSEAEGNSANDCKTTSNQSYLDGSRTEFYIASFVGGTIGLIIGCMILFFFFYYRRHYW